MNILFITNGFPEKDNIGNGIFNYHRYNKLRDMGHKITVCKLNHIRDNGYREAYNLGFINDESTVVEIVNYIQVPKLNIFLKLLPQLKEIVQRDKIDIVQVHFANQGFAAHILKKSLGIPYVVTVQGSDVTNRIHDSAKNRRAITKAVRSADSVIYVSKSLMNIAHKSGIRNKKESIIYNGVSFVEARETSENIKDSPMILFVGSLNYVKRSSYLPDIFKAVSDRVPNAKFRIIGIGENKQLIIDKLAEYDLTDSVHISEGILSQDDVYKHMKDSDLLLLPSRNEGFGCVLVEAMMCGCQVVASRVGGIPEAIGSFGTLVDDGENWVDRFASAIVERLNNPIAVEKLVEWAKSFSWEKTAEKELEVYKKVLNG